ncbi:MAG: type II secretion system protein [Candidatus Buchananbacteria bacterium]
MKNKGLTLIELMVGILIVALISTIGLVAMKNTRAKGRDAKRIYDLQQYAKALIMYAGEHDGKYPDQTFNGTIGCNGLFDAEIKKYLPSLPIDPADPNRRCDTNYYYYYLANNNCTSNGVLVPTVHVQTVETSSRDYHQNPCLAGSEEGSAKTADYLIIVR